MRSPETPSTHDDRGSSSPGDPEGHDTGERLEVQLEVNAVLLTTHKPCHPEEHPKDIRLKAAATKGCDEGSPFKPGRKDTNI
jgi:hypothetical protein